MKDLEEILNALKDLNKVLEEKEKGSKIKITSDDIEEFRAKNKEGIKDRLKKSAEFVCTDNLESYIIVTNEKTCISASRFDTINLLMDLIQYFIDKKVLNEKSIRKIVDASLMPNKEFNEKNTEIFSEIMNALAEDYDNLAK